VKGESYCAISQVPTLRKKREGWGTPCMVLAAEGWATGQNLKRYSAAGDFVGK
jgi:hypothetical protein